MSTKESDHVRPWYRQFWPWFLIAIPLAGIIMASITATVAIRNADMDVRVQATPPLDKTSWRNDGDATP